MRSGKILAFFLALFILVNASMEIAFASSSSELLVDKNALDSSIEEYEVAKADENAPLKKGGATYTCTYDSKSEYVIVSGSVTHDIYISHREYTIRLYKIAPEETIESVMNKEGAEPLAETEISIKFNFTLDVKGINDIFSRYVVVLVSPQMTVDFVGPELYPSVKSEYVSTIDRREYKGITGASDSAMLQSVPSVAVLPVYLDRLISKGSTGYLYSLEGFNVFFDKSYINEIDRSVRDLSTMGAKVYFQILLPSGGNYLLNSQNINSFADYDIPDLSSLNVLNEIYAYCDFLSKRYSSYEYGYIEGMIIGKNLDDTIKYNNCSFAAPDEYAQMLALYGIVVGVATRNNIPDADIAYSFSNINTYNDEKDGTVSFDPSDIIELLCAYFEEYYSDDFDFSIVLESSQTPLNISNETISRGIELSARDDDRYIIEHNMNVFGDFLSYLASSYSSAPKNFMYIWNADEDLGGNALACAYTYLYYKAFFADKLHAFVVSFEGNTDSVYDLLNIIKYIDTKKSNEVTSVLMQFFEKTSWADIIEKYNAVNYITREHVLLNSISDISQNASGVYSYFDFSNASSELSWFEGSGCNNVSIDYSNVLGRALCAEFNPEQLSVAEYSYLYCVYEYPESFAFTPYLSFRITVEGENDYLDLFEVKIAFGNSNNVYEVSDTLHTGEDKKIHIDLSDFSENYMADYIRVSVRPMSEAKGEYKFFVSSLEGKSMTLDDTTLEEYINNERMRIRNELEQGAEIEQKDDDILIAVSVMSAAIILGVMLFIFLKRDDQEDS